MYIIHTCHATRGLTEGPCIYIYIYIYIYIHMYIVATRRVAQPKGPTYIYILTCMYIYIHMYVRSNKHMDEIMGASDHRPWVISGLSFGGCPLEVPSAWWGLRSPWPRPSPICNPDVTCCVMKHAGCVYIYIYRHILRVVYSIANVQIYTCIYICICIIYTYI